MHRIELIFDQMQREGQLLVVELRLDGDLVVGRQPGEQVANLCASIDGQARRSLMQVQLRVVLHALDEIQFVLGQECVAWHRGCSIEGH